MTKNKPVSNNDTTLGSVSTKCECLQYILKNYRAETKIVKQDLVVNT